MAGDQAVGQSGARRCPFASLQSSSLPHYPVHDVLGGGWGPELHRAVAAADPLHADAILPALPHWNAHADTPKLIAALQQLLPSPEELARFGLVESLAAMRDLGMLLGSLRRHGLEPVEAVPACEEPLVALGRRTGMIPRDTVFHYTIWNPSGPRQRSFTGDAQEEALIFSIRHSLPSLDRTIRILAELASTAELTDTFLQRCCAIEAELEHVVEAIDYAKHYVDVIFFAQVLRPYFEPVAVGGDSYLGSAAAHIPLWLVDHLLWASDRSGEELHAFTTDAARHALPVWGALYAAHAESPSLLSRALRALAERPHDPLSDAIAHSVYRSMRTILKFRGKHRVIAWQAYQPGIRKHAVGSGGYAVVSLDGLLKTTIDAANELRHALARH